MADRDNPGQFGNRPDTQEQASKGGKAQSKGAKAKGGKRSRGNR